MDWKGKYFAQAFFEVAHWTELEFTMFYFKEKTNFFARDAGNEVGKEYSSSIMRSSCFLYLSLKKRILQKFLPIFTFENLICYNEIYKAKKNQTH